MRHSRPYIDRVMDLVSHANRNVIMSIHTERLLHQRSCERSTSFYFFDGHCHRQNGLQTYLVRQCNVCYSDGEEIATFGWTLVVTGNWKHKVRNDRTLGF